MKKDLLGIGDLSPDDIYRILDTAEAMREIGERPIKKVPTLRGKTIVNLFYEPSTRTRTSFEIAEKRLSADTLNIAVAASSVLKGETLADTAMNIEAMAPDMIVLRHASSGACHLLARICRSQIINAGDGMHEHPTQALLDAFTIRQHKQRLEGLKVAIVGDLLHSRVLRSNVLLLTKLGADVWVSGPPTLVPSGVERLGVRVTTSVDEAVADADVIMMLRIQQERMQGAFFPSLREYFNVFGMTAERVRRARSRRHHHAPGSDEPRRGNRVRRRRRPLFGDPRAGGQRRRGADGGPLPSRWRGGGGLREAGELTKRLIKGGRLVDPANGRDGAFDLLIEAGRIARVGDNLPRDMADDVVDLPSGLVVCPGLIDMHVHLREPGQEHKETVASGTAAAVAGGFTAVACMPNTTPVNDNAGVTAYILQKAAEANLARVYPIGAVSRGQNGEHLADIAELQQAGCVAITDDGRPVATALLMRRALEYTQMFDMPVIEHCEEQTLKGDGVAHEGFQAHDPRPARDSGRGRIDHGAARHLAGRVDRRHRARRAHERPPDARRRPLRQVARRPGDLRGHPASFRSDRRHAGRAGPLRHEREDESAAARERRIATRCSRDLPTGASTSSPPTTRRTTTTRSTSSSTTRPSASPASKPRSRSVSTAWSMQGSCRWLG